MPQPNAEQTEYWNVLSGPKWVEFADMIDSQIAPIGLRAIDAAGAREGERVLDVGCGCGQTSIELGRRVGSEGEVLGVDLSGPMLEDARRRATEAGHGHVRFERDDAQVRAFETGAFDLAFSRFGVMFFEDSVAAFSNIRGAMASGGRLTFVCWQEIGRNPWMVVPAMSAAKHVELPPRPSEGGPGPFAFADEQYVADLLEQAGWESVQHESIEIDLGIGEGRDLEETVSFLLQMGPAGAALRQASDEIREAARETALADLAPFFVDDALRMSSAAWLFTARTGG